MDDYLDKVEAQLVALTEKGAHRRLLALAPLRPEGGASPNGGPPGRRFRTDFIAFAAGFAVVAALVAVLLGLRGSPPARPVSHPTTLKKSQHPAQRPKHVRRRGSGHSRKTSTVPTTTYVGPVPTGFVPQSFTATGDLTWWMLGNSSCSTPPCTSIVRTSDGGQSFEGIPAPHAHLIPTGTVQIGAPGPSQEGISQLRFADPNNGFAYGPALFVTHDGGRSWRQLDLGGLVTSISISAANAYAIVVGANGTGRLWRSASTADSWVALPAFADAYGGLWAHGADLLAQYNNKVVVSHDAGASFSRYPAPSGLPCDFQEQAPPVVWAHCATGMDSGLWRSTNGGRTFKPSQRSTGGVGLAPEPNSAPFAAASSTTAVFGYQQLYRTTDGGATFAPVGPHGLTWMYLGFTDPMHGVALGFPNGSSSGNEQLYYTTDAGVTYHQVPIG